MAVRNIVRYAQNVAALRKKSRPVRGMSQGVRRLVLDLKDTLAKSSDGIGLAAPQINVHRRIVVIRLGSRNEEGAVRLPVYVYNNLCGLERAGNRRRLSQGPHPDGAGGQARGHDRRI